MSEVGIDRKIWWTSQTMLIVENMNRREEVMGDFCRTAESVIKL